MSDTRYARLGDILVASGELTRDQLMEALDKKAATNKRLGQVLVESGHISAKRVAAALSLQFDLELANFDNFPLDAEATGLVPETLCREHGIVPLRRDGDELICATADPIDMVASDQIERMTDCGVRLLIATEQEIVEQIEQRYGLEREREYEELPIGVGHCLLHYDLVNLRWNEPAAAFFEADDTRLLRRVLVGIVRPSEHPDTAARGQKLLEHSMWLARFPHRNILTVHDVGEYAGLRFVVSEALPGETLRERLVREERLSLTAGTEIALQLCEALRHLHRYQLVYQSLTPGNCVMIDDEVKLTHLDIRLNPREMTVASGATGDDYRYLSPEQIKAEPVDYRSDIFVLGSLLYEMAVGRPAFGCASVASVSQLIREAALSASDELPASLNRIILRACAKERHARFPDTLSFAEELLSHHWPEVISGRGAQPHMSQMV